MDALNLVIVDSYKPNNPKTDVAAAEELMARIAVQLGDDARYLEAQGLQNREEYSKACKAFIDLYMLVLSNDKASAANGLRYMFSPYSAPLTVLAESLETQLMAAAIDGDTESVSKLLEAGADVNARGGKGWTVLMCASSEGHVDTVHELLARGAEVDAREAEDWTALMYASIEGHVETVQALLAGGADANAKDKDGDTSLIRAAVVGHESVVKVLVEKGADPNIKDREGLTALMLAAEEGHADVTRLLLDSGADVNARQEEGNTPLIGAAWAGYTEVAKMLLDADADPNAKNNDNVTALMKAAVMGNSDIVRVLIDKGADIKAKTEDGYTAMMIATTKGHTEVVQLLEQSGAEAFDGLFQWSTQPGWRERHLKRRLANSRFPENRRGFSQEELATAQKEDRAEAAKLESKIKSFVIEVADTPKRLSFEESHEIQVRLDELIDACILCGKQMDSQNEMLKEMRVLLTEEMRVAAASISDEAYEFYKETDAGYNKGREIYSNRLVLELPRIPPEDVLSTLLSATVDDLKIVMKVLGDDEETLRVLKDSTERRVAELYSEGVDIPQITEKLQIIFQHSASDGLLAP